MKKHDENKDVRILQRYLRVDTHNKVIKASKDTVVGIRLWGRIDYLTKHRGWFFIWDNDVKRKVVPTDTDVKVKTKPEQHKLSDKR